MTYDQERAQEPANLGPKSAKRRAAQATPAEPTRPPLQSGATTEAAGRTGNPMLIPQGDRDKMTMRLQQALNSFVEDPHGAVREADGVFDDAATHLANTLTERHRTLRAGWQDMGTSAQTEELRLALKQYQEITERLLRI